MKKRIYLSLVLLSTLFINSFGYSVSEFSNDLKQLNTTYILPILGAAIGLYAIISGLLRIGKIRKGGEEQTDAIMNWLGSLLWPVVVVLVGEGLVLIFTSVFS